MQHVKKQWLTFFALVLVGIDLIIFGVYAAFKLTQVSQTTQSHWGLATAILVIAGMHILYVALIFPFLRKRFEWLATIISISIYAILFAAIIDTSGNTNLFYRFGYAGLVFFMGMNGPFAPIATIVLTWLIMVFAYVGVVTPTNASPLLNIAINIVVTLAGLGGWLFFRRYYILSNPQAVALTRLLKQSQYETNAILESITDGVLIVSTDGTTRVINQSAAKMFGVEQANAIKQSYHDLLPEQNEKTTMQSTIDDCARLGKTVQNTSLFTDKTGRKFYVDIVASPIYDDAQDHKSTEQHVVGIVAVIRDVDQKQRHEQRQRDFVATASHEMRTPVASINGFLELALSPDIRHDDEKLVSYLGKARGTVEHLSELVNQLLLVSQGEDNAFDVDTEAVDIVPVVIALSKEYLPSAQSKDIKIVTDPLPDSAIITTNAQHVRLILSNLMSNAIKYTNQQGTVMIGVKHIQTGIAISVTDTGIGISESDLPELFQKFHRVDNSATRVEGGTGLGLYITKLLVRALAGDITVNSTVGQGTTFTVTLPNGISAQQG